MQSYLSLVLSGIASLAKVLRILQPFTNSLRKRTITLRRRIRKEWALILVVVLLTASAVVAGTRWHYRADFRYKDSADDVHLIHHQVFSYEVVPLDGRRYVACIFRNVMLEYNGTAPFGLENNRFFGPIALKTKNKSISTAILLLKGLGLTTVPIFESETGEAIQGVAPPQVQTAPRSGASR